MNCAGKPLEKKIKKVIFVNGPDNNNNNNAKHGNTRRHK